ncbi:hypothetical protein Y032_0350g3222 [Ancylostoma ceylanicum]|uniref:Uncharacterized protein n=1 Tax=Ancylostoma ceylanicum TaxID=53326 RepID=A0A016RXU6_9BILA|nr:hypothetical protein Y032_0350g3222 [Ancylostoma ceylanicum]
MLSGQSRAVSDAKLVVFTCASSPSTKLHLLCIQRKTVCHMFVLSAVIGELDEELDKRIDLENVKAAPLAPIWIQG